MSELNNNRSLRGLRWLALSLLVLLLDQWSKTLITEAMDLHQVISLAPLINLTYVVNEGAAFSLLSDASGWQRWPLVLVAVILSGMILWWLLKPAGQRIGHSLPLALILGGAWGNLWDRISLGHVIDFIDVYYGGWHWPAFNIADSAITVGAILLVVDTIWGNRA